MVLLQIGVEGFQDAAQMSTLFGVLVSSILILAGAVIILFRMVVQRNKEILTLQKDSSEKILDLSENHVSKLDEIRKEIMNKDEKRFAESKETEKEVLSILNGLSQILELGRANSKSENIVIDTKLNDINEKLNTIIDSMIKKKIN